jgi:hypothetical protein
MFGTNFLQLTWKACVESGHRHLKLREEVKADFYGGNAARVLKLDVMPCGEQLKFEGLSDPGYSMNSDSTWTPAFNFSLSYLASSDTLA